MLINFHIHLIYKFTHPHFTATLSLSQIAVAARSLVGECTSKCTMTQKKLPCEVVEGLPNVTNGPEGDDLTLNVTIRASPRPTFSW